MTADSLKYRRPPLTEAVIELRFNDAQPQKAVEAVAKRLGRDYVNSEIELDLEFSLTMQDRAPPSSKHQSKWSGMKLSSGDRADVVFIRPLLLATCRLAPYPGWEVLRERAERNFDGWKRELGATRIVRIGIRFINRIDIPTGDTPLRYEDYMLVKPQLPIRQEVQNFVMQADVPLGEDEFRLVVNAGTLPSPLLGAKSLLLDIDIFREGDLPQRDDEIWKLAEKMRAQKNQIFEACITDRSRELFNS